MAQLRYILVLSLVLAAVAHTQSDEASAEQAVEPEGIATAIDERDLPSSVNPPKDEGVEPVASKHPNHKRHAYRNDALYEDHEKNRHNSHPVVEYLQRSAAPFVNFRRKNFGLPFNVTHVANISIGIDGLYSGSVLIALFGTKVPKTVQNFIELVTGEHGYGYAGSTVTQLVPRYLVQFGAFDYAYEGKVLKGGRAVFQTPVSEVPAGVDPYYFADENYVVKHLEGTVSMAAASQRNRAQFFIAATPRGYDFNKKHVAFGHVIGGYRDVIQLRVMKQRHDAEMRPLGVITILNCSVVRHSGHVWDYHAKFLRSNPMGGESVSVPLPTPSADEDEPDADDGDDTHDGPRIPHDVRQNLLRTLSPQEQRELEIRAAHARKDAESKKRERARAKRSRK